MNPKNPIECTQDWIENFVLAHNLCPFAHIPFKNHRIRYTLSPASDLALVLSAFIDELLWLEAHPETQTSFLIIDDHALPFLDYLDILATAEHTLEEANLQSHYQIASFHPQYCFEDAPQDDPANASNQSPFPMLHLLRCADVENARHSHPNVEGIPDRNIQYLRSLASHKKDDGSILG